MIGWAVLGAVSAAVATGYVLHWLEARQEAEDGRREQEEFEREEQLEREEREHEIAPDNAD